VQEDLDLEHALEVQVEVMRTLHLQVPLETLEVILHQKEMLAELVTLKEDMQKVVVAVEQEQ
jgi:hypothetical protein|tara:strand:+ start:126 stop:311 length:186 start_codon:yes stop_codon:yes gene_type:complete